MMRNMSVVGAVLALLSGAAAGYGAANEEWAIFPSSERGKIKTYVPAFEKHFKVADGVLIGSCNLGADIFNEHKCSSFEGTGPIWVTQPGWPKDAADFELTFDYKWFQAEPMAKFGDFPDMTVGLRLNQEGRGYVLQWGMLGQVRLERMDPRGGLVGQGQHRGMKGTWTKVRILAAGPILKVKIWPETLRGQPQSEPERWNVEAYDNWEGTDQKDFLKGVATVGFTGRKLFDTCVYEYRNVQLRLLSPEETAGVKFFEPRSAPTGPRGSADVSNIAAPEMQGVSAATVAAAEKTGNLAVEATEQAVVLKSTDGENAFAWKKVQRDSKILGLRAKSSGSARPLVAVNVTDSEGRPQMAYLDPAWRNGIGALLHDNKNHTANSGSLQWKADTEYDFLIHAAHWLKWQIVEVGNPSNRLNFSARTYEVDRSRSEKFLGLGVAGKDGTVTVTGIVGE